MRANEDRENSKRVGESELKAEDQHWACVSRPLPTEENSTRPTNWQCKCFKEGRPAVKFSGDFRSCTVLACKHSCCRKCLIERAYSIEELKVRYPPRR
jgi:hypothetical protein